MADYSCAIISTTHHYDISHQHHQNNNDDSKEDNKKDGLTYPTAMKRTMYNIQSNSKKLTRSIQVSATYWTSRVYP